MISVSDSACQSAKRRRDDGATKRNTCPSASAGLDRPLHHYHLDQSVVAAAAAAAAQHAGDAIADVLLPAHARTHTHTHTLLARTCCRPIVRCAAVAAEAVLKIYLSHNGRQNTHICKETKKWK